MVKVACLQMWLQEGESKEDRIQQPEKMIDGAAGADLVVLPEVWNIGGIHSIDTRIERKPLEEKPYRGSQKSEKSECLIMAGTIIEKEVRKLITRRSSLIQKGRSAGHSARCIPGMAGPEREYITRGEKMPRSKPDIESSVSAFAYDLRFPGLYRKMQ